MLRMRSIANSGREMTAHSVLQELILYLCHGEALALREIGMGGTPKVDSNDWVFDLFGDMDIVTCLYSDVYLQEDNAYHFSHWNEPMFYMDPKKE